MADLSEVDELIQAHVDFEAQSKIPTPQDRAHSNLIDRFNLKGYIYNNLTFEQLEQVKCNLFQTENKNGKNENKSERDLSVKVRYATAKELKDVGVLLLVNGVQMPTLNYQTVEQQYAELPSLVKMAPKIYETVDKRFFETIEIETMEAKTSEIMEDETLEAFETLEAVETPETKEDDTPNEGLEDKTLEAVEDEFVDVETLETMEDETLEDETLETVETLVAETLEDETPKVNAIKISPPNYKPVDQEYAEMPSLVKMTPKIYQTIEKIYVENFEAVEAANGNLCQAKTTKATKSKRNKPHQCSSCGHTFAAKRKLKKHFESVHVGNIRSTRGKTFASKRGMQKHFGCVHEEIKPFKCQACEIFFPAKKILHRHIAAVHEGKKIKRKLMAKQTFWC